jgi:transcriptional activator SPT7
LPCTNFLQESDRQVNADQNGSTSQEEVNFGAAKLSLKHLLGVIDSNRDALSITDAELGHLFAEVRKNRSKWVCFEVYTRLT